ncbi:MAG: MaoC family dehydratase [Alphaproteobacteria bacterium]|nr:MaoC family dehydratase [Alphaproteobacteria bacterium]MBL6776591.1 MaoC family dehydratase [Alphaproteobacteria bacterium]
MNIEALRKKIGTLMGSSNWYLLDQDRINQFAVVAQDEQFIHTDPEKAAKTPFGTTIAHGFLTLALLPAMGGDVIPKLDGHLMSVNYGFEKLRFLSPVPAGSRVRGHFTLSSLDVRKPGEVTLLWEVSIEIEGREKPAVYAEWINRRYLKI